MNLRAGPALPALLLLLLLGWAGPAPAQDICAVPAPAGHDRDALWRIVRCQCTPAAAQALAPPWPCTALSRDAALLKDIRGQSQYLLIPAARVTGIEDPALLAPGAPNHFAEAWRARGLVGLALGRGLPRDAVSLAINAAIRRSQDQLHIHLDCLRPDLRAALAEARIGEGWAPLGAAWPGWQARRLPGEGDDLAADPFAVLASELPGARAAMGEWTLLVTQVAAPPGFVLLAGRQPESGNAERLQDHGCALAR